MNRWIALAALVAIGASVGCTTTPRNTYGTPYVAPAYPATTYGQQAYPATTQYVAPTYQPVPGPVAQPPQVVYQQPAAGRHACAANHLPRSRRWAMRRQPTM